LSESFWTLLNLQRVRARMHFCLCHNSISRWHEFDWQFPCEYFLALVKTAFAHLLLSSCRRELIEIFLRRILRRVRVSAVKFDQWRHNSGRRVPSSLSAVHVDVGRVSAG